MSPAKYKVLEPCLVQTLVLTPRGEREGGREGKRKRGREGEGEGGREGEGEGERE